METQYQSFEGAPFKPERRRISRREGQELMPLPTAFREAYGLMIEAGLDEEEGIPGARRRVREYGQIAGKLHLRIVEGMPMSAQEKMIAILRERCQTIHQKRGVPMNGFLSGVMGEFATGVLLTHADLEIIYPTKEQDLYHKTDLLTTSPSGRIIIVNSKMISLPESMNREYSEPPLPIISSVETDDDLKKFRSAIEAIPHEIDSPLGERIGELNREAEALSNEARKSGSLPLISLLASTGGLYPDINVVNFRPTPVTEAQAREELGGILRT